MSYQPPNLVLAGLIGIPPIIATVVFLAGIAYLFHLDREKKPNISKALWIPTIWLLISGSRPVSLWFQGGKSMETVAQYNVEANPINIIIFSVLLIAGLAVLSTRTGQVAKLLPSNLPILLYFLYCAVSTVWSEYPLASFRHWIRSLGDPVMVLLILTESDLGATLKRLFARLGFVLLPLSVLLIKYYPSTGRLVTMAWENMYIGVTDHKNTLGVVCLVLGLGFLWRLSEHLRMKKDDPDRKRHLLADGIILLTVVWLLRICSSMTSITCLAMATIIFWVTTRTERGRKVGAVHLLMASMVGLSLFALFLDPTGGLVGTLGRNPTLTGRTAVWHQVIDLAGNPVFGTGFESFWLGDRIREIWINNTGDLLNEAHNGYLEVWLNLGWCGVALLGLMIVTGYRNVIASFRRDRRLGGLKLAYLLAAVNYSLTEAGFRMMSIIWIFFLLVTTNIPEPHVREASTADREITPADHWGRDYEGVA